MKNVRSKANSEDPYMISSSFGHFLLLMHLSMRANHVRERLGIDIHGGWVLLVLLWLFNDEGNNPWKRKTSKTFHKYLNELHNFPGFEKLPKCRSWSLYKQQN